jgi:hypothetical protein
MTNCLTDEAVQAVADDEADARARAHAAECPHCGARVEETRRALATLGALGDQLPAPPSDLARRVQQRMQEMGAARERGATTLRTAPSSSRAWRAGAWTSGLAAAALIVLAVFVVWPGMSRESHLSAAEILGRSLQTFSATSGIETFEYDARFDGLAAQALGPDALTGDTLRITQVIDHDHPGRFRVMSVDARQGLRSVLVQDPEQGTRVGRFRVDDRTYFFRFTASPGQAGTFISLPDLQRAYLRALVTMMQTTANQTLTSVNDAGEAYYAIQIPPISSDRDAGDSAGVATMLELRDAHALIHAGDFHLKELSAHGSVLGQPFGLAFTLVRHEATAPTQLAADTFTLEPEPGDVRLEGAATNDPPGDVVLAALRALAKVQP